MNYEREILELIDFIKKMMSEMDDKDYWDANKVFLNGNCGNLYDIFKKYISRYAIPFIISYKGEDYHIVTKIGQYYYDITGRTDLALFAKYIREHNRDERDAQESDCQIEQLTESDPRLTKRKYMYNYWKEFDEQWGVSYSQQKNKEIMKMLDFHIKRFEEQSR